MQLIENADCHAAPTTLGDASSEADTVGASQPAATPAPDGADGEAATPLAQPSVEAAPEPPLSKRKLAEILVAIAEDPSRERVAVSDLLTAMEDRAFGALMLIFAMPNALPTPPGTSAILGAPLVFLAAQLMCGRQPWLPALIADRSMLRTDFATMIEKAAPWIAWAERLLKPRMVSIARPPSEYVIGAVCLLMATILFLPIPLGNMLPALAICMFSLGLLERDGVWVLAGLVVSIVSAVIVSGVVFALAKAAMFVMGQMFS